MIVWLSMSCMYISVRIAAGGTSCLATSPHGMASRSRAPERATQASRSNKAIAVGQKYYPQEVQNQRKSVPHRGSSSWATEGPGRPDADGLEIGQEGRRG